MPLSIIRLNNSLKICIFLYDLQLLDLIGDNQGRLSKVETLYYEYGI